MANNGENREKDEVREHSFDGIQEYDNDLPRWWVWLFVVTIVFAVIYPFVYDFGPGTFPSETIDAEMAALKEANKKTVVAGPQASEIDWRKLVASPQVISAGREIFTQRCVVCHGDKGQGIVGPNLTDSYWIHGGKISDIQKVVTEGVLEKGMLAWKDQLTADQINAVVAFVWTLYDTHPEGAKEPQGVEVEREDDLEHEDNE